MKEMNLQNSSCKSKYLELIEKIDRNIFWVLFVGIVIRIVYYLSINQDIIYYSDSWTYLNCAKVMGERFYIDVYRPPVYPLVLLLCALVFSWDRFFIGLIIIQVFLSMISTVLIYKIGLIISNNKPVSLLAALVVNISISTFGWDFMIMSENFSIFLITLITYTLLKYFQTQNIKYLYALAADLLLLVFTKPFFIGLPIFIIIIFILYYPLNKVKYHSRPLFTFTISICLIYAFVFGYCTLNNKINGFYGITSVSNVNCFGKILQYKMEAYGDNTKLKDDINNAYISTPKDNLVRGEYLEPWGFLGKYGWANNNYFEPGRFSSSIIKNNLILYITNSLQLTANLMIELNPFRDFIAINAIDNNSIYSRFINMASVILSPINSLYFLIPLFLLELLIYIAAFKISYIKSHIGPLIVLLLILYHYLMSAFFSYGDYCRLLAPSYYLIYLLMIFNLFRILHYLLNVVKIYLY